MKMLKKLVAPILITALLVCVFIAYALVCFLVPYVPLALKWIGGLITFSLCGVSVYVLIERIQEIRSGDEDDLSQY
jgi:membrane protein implicated in regulation of membrane protease activity